MSRLRAPRAANRSGASPPPSVRAPPASVLRPLRSPTRCITLDRLLDPTDDHLVRHAGRGRQPHHITRRPMVDRIGAARARGLGGKAAILVLCVMGYRAAPSACRPRRGGHEDRETLRPHSAREIGRAVRGGRPQPRRRHASGVPAASSASSSSSCANCSGSPSSAPALASSASFEA